MKRFYVYMLVDPRDAMPFYVGKGTAARKNAHSHRVVVKDTEKSAKAVRVRAILAEGMEVGSVIVKRFDVEADALAFERATIERLGLGKLTNQNVGGGGDVASKKLSLKQQKFIEEYNVHGDGRKAAISAGYAEGSAAVSAHRNLQNPVIAALVTFAKQQHAAKCEVTKESIAEELNENRELALQTFQLAPANQATLGKAKLFGLLVEKSEVKVTEGLADRLRRAKERAAKAAE